MSPPRLPHSVPFCFHGTLVSVRGDGLQSGVDALDVRL